MEARGRRQRRSTRAVVAAAACVPVVLAACAGPSGTAPSRPAPTASSPVAPAAAGGPATPSSGTASPSPATAPSAAAAPACSDRVAAAMTATQRAAQVLTVGVDAGRPAAAGASLARLGVGGVFLRGRVPGGTSLRAGIRAVQAARHAGTPVLFVSADEEGGAVQTVRGGTVPAFPAALVQGTWSGGTLRARTLTWARELAHLGVNLDLAPVADVVPASVGRRNPPIGRYGREYASTPGAVAPAVATVVRALRSAGVGPTVKHFPGLGRVLVNTDTGTGALDGTTTATDPALGPFTAGTAAGAVAVMVSSARYPRLDAKHPAMWSRAVVTGLLRMSLGWTGMVVSDDLGQAAAATILPVGRRAVDFVAAGGDLVLTVRPEQARTMRDALAARAKTDASFRARLDEAVRHVLAAKQTLGLLRC